MTTIKKEKIKIKKVFNKKCKNCNKLLLECEEYKHGWKRALADYTNLQKEIIAKKGEWIKMSEVQILEEFLPVYEHLKMSIDNDKVKTSNDPWVEGVKYVLKQFRDILEQHGITEIETVGKKFDPQLHEAVSEEQGEKNNAGTVLKEIKSGYRIGDKILRAAQVIVCKN